MATDERVGRLEENVRSVFFGTTSAVRLALLGLLCEGHVLFEDVPGVGKTTLARAIARSIDGTFRRIQFTPDLLPSDVTGVSVFDQARQAFEFQPGPIFGNVVLADEINRTTPRTQSALLEAMNEFQVSADGETHPLPRPFLVLATQNPFEFEGTYPLPESQLDRFILRTRIGYPSRDDERRVLESRRTGSPLDELRPVLSTDDVLDLQRGVREVRVDDAVQEYVLSIVEATRSSREVQVGVSPRGTLHLVHGIRALAFCEGRDHVLPDDVKRLAVPILAHRMVARGGASGRDDPREREIRAILDRVAVPI